MNIIQKYKKILDLPLIFSTHALTH